MFATWEDDGAECWRRVEALHSVGAAWAEPKALATRLHLIRPPGALWSADRTGNAAALARLQAPGERLFEFAERQGARLVVIDPVAAAFGASEIDRAQVRAFCGWLDAWAQRAECAVVLLQHPPKAERASAGGSGSTDWRNAPRAVLLLRRERPDGSTEAPKTGDDDRSPVLRLEKSNYGKRPGPVHLSRKSGPWRMHWREVEAPAAASPSRATPPTTWKRWFAARTRARRDRA